MKRARAQQPKNEDSQDPATAAANPKPQQRRAKQPRQPKAGGGGGAKTTKAGAAGARAAAASAAASIAAAAAANAASSSPGVSETMAPTVPDVCVVGGGGDADGARAVDWDLDDDAAMNDAAAAWWTWGVDEEKLLGWFPFVEEDFRCAGARAGDAEVAAFDHDIWSIW